MRTVVIEIVTSGFFCNSRKGALAATAKLDVIVVYPGIDNKDGDTFPIAIVLMQEDDSNVSNNIHHSRDRQSAANLVFIVEVLINPIQPPWWEILCGGTLHPLVLDE